MKRSLLVLATPAASLALALGALPACNRTSEAPAEAPAETAPAHGVKAKRQAGPIRTKVTAFDVHPENLNVDKISMRDGIFSPDGSRDLVFTATVEGPADALYLVTVDEKGAPVHGFRADTISGHEELPHELSAAGQVDVGRLTVWMAVSENGKFINEEGGKLGSLPEGAHVLKMYVPNTNTLRPGSRLRLYARGPGGAIVAGPAAAY